MSKAPPAARRVSKSKVATGSKRKPDAKPEMPPPPQMKVTGYDRTSAALIAVVAGLIMATAWLWIVWMTNWEETTDDTVPLELIELPGGYEDGAPDETLKVESPEDVSDDPSVAEIESEETEIQEMVETVMEFSDQASQQATQQFSNAPQNTGKVGSATGTGRRPLGSGGGEGGPPREQRWFIRFNDGTQADYERQLDHFGIELGLLQNNQLILLSNLSNSKPTKRVLDSGKERTDWMYFTWRGGNRKAADRKLFQKAGVNITNGTIFHFYPKQTEQLLATTEFQYAKKPSSKIRRTYFSVRSGGGNTPYRFVVTKQFSVR